MRSADPAQAHTGARRTPTGAAYPEPRAVLELFKPITWFPPMWAYSPAARSRPALAPLARSGLRLF
jgi:hypothetical protein